MHDRHRVDVQACDAHLITIEGVARQERMGIYQYHQQQLHDRDTSKQEVENTMGEAQYMLDTYLNATDDWVAKQTQTVTRMRSVKEKKKQFSLLSSILLVIALLNKPNQVRGGENERVFFEKGFGICLCGNSWGGAERGGVMAQALFFIPYPPCLISSLSLLLEYFSSLLSFLI